MAITINSRPYSLVPAHNEAWFEAISNQIAQPNFVYYVDVTEETGGNSYIFEISPDPVGDLCYFNLRPVMEKFVANYFPLGLNDWKNVINGINKFTVNIGEKYGSTPSVTPGSDIDIYAWNGCLTRKERSVYLPENYNNQTSAADIICLNDFGTELTIKYDQDLVFYFLENGEKVDKLTVATYDQGGLYNTFVLSNNLNVATTAGKYASVQCGPRALNDLYTATPGRFSSVFQSPLFDGTELYYEINFTNSGATKSLLYTVTIDNGCSRFENVTVFYQNRKGAFDYVNMYGNHRKRIDINKSFYKGIIPAFEESYTNAAQSSDFTISPEPVALDKKVLAINYETKRTLKTNWLTDEEVDRFQDLITSPVIIVQNDYMDYDRYSQDDIAYEFKQGTLDKQINLEIQLSQGIERRQPT